MPDLLPSGNWPWAIGSRRLSLYDAVRAADVPKPARLAATRGAILVRGGPLLAEQLKSDDDAMFIVAVGASRRLPGRDVTQLLLDTLGAVPPARQVLRDRRAGRASRPGRACPPCRRPRQVVPSRSGWRRFCALGDPGRSVQRCRCCWRPLRPANRPWPKRHRPAWPNWPARASMRPSRPSWSGPTPPPLDRANAKTPRSPCWTSSRGGGSSPPRPPR